MNSHYFYSILATTIKELTTITNIDETDQEISTIKYSVPTETVITSTESEQASTEPTTEFKQTTIIETTADNLRLHQSTEQVTETSEPEATTAYPIQAEATESVVVNTTKNAWKLVPIITPLASTQPQGNDKLKLGLFGFQRPSLSSLGFNRPVPAPAAVAPSPTAYTATVNLKPASADNLGLESTIQGVSQDIQEFSTLCNELAFNIWNSVTAKGVSAARSVVISPFAITSMLSMIFLGARGPTSGEMNEILKLDDMVTFNPHLVLRNVTDSIEKGKGTGVVRNVMIRQLFSDKGKGKLLEFYKERARQFYNGHVEEANFKIIGNLIKHRTNLLVKKETDEAIPDFIRGNLITLRPPLAAISANIFQVSF